MSSPARPAWRGRAKILLIVLISVLPFALAWYYAKHPALISKTTNYGTLVIPVRSLDYGDLLKNPVSRPDGVADIKGHWVLLQISDGPCGPECAETLHKTHQARLMLNKEIPRLRRLLLVPANAAVGTYDAPIKQDETLAVAAYSPALRQVIGDAVGGSFGPGTIVLLDPLANLVLWYGAGFDPYGLVKDLKHLLRASHIG